MPPLPPSLIFSFKSSVAVASCYLHLCCTELWDQAFFVPNFLSASSCFLLFSLGDIFSSPWSSVSYPCLYFILSLASPTPIFILSLGLSVYVLLMLFGTESVHLNRRGLVHLTEQWQSSLEAGGSELLTRTLSRCP